MQGPFFFPFSSILFSFFWRKFAHRQQSMESYFAGRRSGHKKISDPNALPLTCLTRIYPRLELNLAFL